MTTIDLNSDIGEGFGRWSLGDDEAMLGLVSSANIACGFHAGDPRAILATASTAAANGVAIGAHVAYRDLAGFGRRDMDVASEDLVPEVIYQIGALQALAASVGGRVGYVKPHGALYNRIAHDERQAADVVRAVKEVDPSLVLLGLPDSTVLRLAERAGLPTAREAFADRAYTPEGRLVSRREPGSVLHDAGEVAERMLRLVETGELTAIDGSVIRLEADSICVHGDSPGAEAMAREVKARLDAAGVAVSPFARAAA
ncbi:LamB/YcsF family protein [Homoserinibacter sp. YIM 151385]|uniref:LamB/YcsF family protein n=1 Tax=Homoserinibacter sp. YIM 151385 TaxID=2985506 RepID=UPI0022F09B72|nr:5-oxoprolinase subunit PxpA [Homoserinibacter sp. YIM 151385]WBU37882.1 LamB/YcsF family protein [Homoserinibacter sp. YIM 151385]